MKRKILAFLLLIVMMATLAVPASAQEQQVSFVRTEFEDGSYCITTVVVTDSPSSYAAGISTKSGTKYKEYYSSENKLQFTIAVTGTFTYDGTSAAATSAYYSYKITESAWTFKNGSAGYAGAIARATCSFRHSSGNGKTLTVFLSCSADGTLS